ncbi:MAG: methylamine utilization protein [Gammaproteobacteria bacterium]
MAAFCLFGLPLAAAELTVRVTAAGAPLDAVVVAVHGGSRTEHAARTHVVDQVDKQFVPRVAAIGVGDQVSFPNSDDIRHHVYSFSPAKAFELPLYHGIPAEPVRFATAGKVVLGCNIHDQMAAWVYVLDAEHFAVAADGVAHFPGLAAGRYEIALWHPQQAVEDEGVRRVVELGADAHTVDLSVELVPPPAPPASATLSPLEARFRALREAAAADASP